MYGSSQLSISEMSLARWQFPTRNGGRREVVLWYVPGFIICFEAVITYSPSTSRSDSLHRTFRTILLPLAAVVHFREMVGRCADCGYIVVCVYRNCRCSQFFDKNFVWISLLTTILQTYYIAIFVDRSIAHWCTFFEHYVARHP